MSLKPLYLWLIALNVMCIFPFTYGPVSFVCLITSIIILWQQLPATTGSNNITPVNTLTVLTIIISIFAAISCIAGLVYQPEWLVKMGGIIDIGANTYAATDAFAHGLNPYTTATQLWVEQFPANTPHMETVNGQLTMYGIPYFHGYPYFPLMLLSYLPAYFIFDGYTAIRVTHIVLMVLNIAAFKLLFDKLLANKEQRRIAFFIAITAYLGLLRYTIEAVLLGVTDILISTYLLYCFVALSQQRYLVAGILLGCAQACKLLPAPFVFFGIVWMLYNNKALTNSTRPLWQFLTGFILAGCIIMLPFIFWHPQGFLSSTILYYLTHHQEGDASSLWHELPNLVKTPFLVSGIIFTLTIIIAFAKRGNNDLIACMTGSYASYVVFMAFSKMTHLNYLWGVFPLGCVALAVALLTKSTQKLSITQ